MQNTDSQMYTCPECQAAPGVPCVTPQGEAAESAHYGRAEPSGRFVRAREEAKRTLRTSPLRPTPAATGIWIGSAFIRRGESVPYGAWCCPCGESLEAMTLAGVMAMNQAYAEHAPCRNR